MKSGKEILPNTQPHLYVNTCLVTKRIMVVLLKEATFRTSFSLAGNNKLLALFYLLWQGAGNFHFQKDSLVFNHEGSS